MANLRTMYAPQPNTPETSLRGALAVDGTTVTVLDSSVLPDAPNLLTIGADTTSAETVLMTAKDGNTLTITRGQDGTTPRAWAAGDVIGRYFTAYDQSAIQENIGTLNDRKVEKVSGPVSGNLPAFDGTTGALKDSGKKPSDFAAHDHTHDGYVQKVQSPASGNFPAFDGTTGALKDSGKKPSDFAAATHSHSGYAEAKIFQNVTVDSTAWVNSSAVPGFSFAAAISCSGVTGDFFADVVFGAAEATSGTFAPVASTASGTVTIYAAEKPTAAITIPAIKCVKVVQ